MQSSVLKVKPLIEPVGVQELSDLAGIPHNMDDKLLEVIISKARADCEAYTERVFINQTWVTSFDEWPDDGIIEVPHPPLSSVVELRVRKADDTFDVIDSSLYYLDKGASPGKVHLESGATSFTPARSHKGIEIEYVAGYGEKATDVDSGFRGCVLQVALEYYETRIFTLSDKAKKTLTPWRIIRV